MKRHIEYTPMEDEIHVTDRREVLGGVFGTVIIEPIQQHDLLLFFQVSRNTILAQSKIHSPKRRD